MNASRRSVSVVGGLALSLTLQGVVFAAAADEGPAIVRDADWHMRESLSGGVADQVIHYGRIDDTPLLCDWDANGVATPGITRLTPTRHWEWHLRNSLSGGPADVRLVYGLERDARICGDWDGDGHQTPGVVRRRADNRFEWHLTDTLTGGTAQVRFVYGSDIFDDPDRLPVRFLVGDWNDDGRDTVGIVRHRPDGRFEWHLRNELAGGAADITFRYHHGAVSGDPDAADIPVAGDWNGDGTDTVGVVRKRSGTRPLWLLRDAHADGPPDHRFVYGSRVNLQWPLVWTH